MLACDDDARDAREHTYTTGIEDSLVHNIKHMRQFKWALLVFACVAALIIFAARTVQTATGMSMRPVYMVLAVLTWTALTVYLDMHTAIAHLKRAKKEAAR